ncbi:MAG: hypothetical protein ACRCXZ_03970, partial [Patescibacteria group bacterium]
IDMMVIALMPGQKEILEFGFELPALFFEEQLPEGHSTLLKKLKSKLLNPTSEMVFDELFFDQLRAEVAEQLSTGFLGEYPEQLKDFGLPIKVYFANEEDSKKFWAKLPTLGLQKSFIDFYLV